MSNVQGLCPTSGSVCHHLCGYDFGEYRIHLTEIVSSRYRIGLDRKRTAYRHGGGVSVDESVDQELSRGQYLPHPVRIMAVKLPDGERCVIVHRSPVRRLPSVFRALLG